MVWNTRVKYFISFQYSSFSGYKYVFNEQLVTVWSAPNYCYRCGNVASILEFSDVDTRTPKLFEAVPDSNRVIPPRITTPYFLWNVFLHLWSSHFCVIKIKQRDQKTQKHSWGVKIGLTDTKCMICYRHNSVTRKSCHSKYALWN